MNERIKELLEQAGVKYVKMPNDTVYAKFAELLVKECLRQVEEQYQPVLEDAVMMKDTHWDGYVQCGVDSYVAIKLHFFGEEE